MAGSVERLRVPKSLKYSSQVAKEFLIIIFREIRVKCKQWHWLWTLGFFILLILITLIARDWTHFRFLRNNWFAIFQWFFNVSPHTFGELSCEWRISKAVNYSNKRSHWLCGGGIIVKLKISFSMRRRNLNFNWLWPSHIFVTFCYFIEVRFSVKLINLFEILHCSFYSIIYNWKRQ